MGVLIPFFLIGYCITSFPFNLSVDAKVCHDNCLANNNDVSVTMTYENDKPSALQASLLISCPTENS